MMGSDKERSEVITRLTEAARLLQEGMDPHLAPVTGAPVAFAIRGARTSEGIAVIRAEPAPGRRTVTCTAPPIFGADDEIKTPLLTALKFDPMVRSAAQIRYSDPVFRILTDMVMESVTLPLNNRVGDSCLLDWAVASACSEGVPDLIAAPGTTSGMAGILLFGEDPVRIASNIIILSNRIQ